jgi:hypothetical protein
VIGLCATSLILTGCGTATLSGATECRVFQRITYSSRDTTQTQREVRGHNAAGVAACGWRAR